MGRHPSPAYFISNEVIFSLPSGSEGNVSADVIGLVRQYTLAQTTQPDIHFLNMYTDKGMRYSSLRITSDSLGALALTPSTRGTATLSVKLNLNDSLIKLHAND